MKIPWQMVAGWYHAVLLAALPWCAGWAPRWAALVLAGAAVVHGAVRRNRAAEPWCSALVLLSAAIFIGLTAAPVGATGLRFVVVLWLAIASAVAAVARYLPREDGGRPDAADVVALLGWSVTLAAAPSLLEPAGGGWLAPALMLLAARQLGSVMRARTGGRRERVGPPSREVRGTLSLRGVIGPEGELPATAPIDLDLRAGESLAVLCDDYSAAQVLADLVAGRRRPFDGEVLIDGAPIRTTDCLAAVVAPGEPFVEGGLIRNLGALREDAPDRSTLGAARDACALAEVVEALGDRGIAADGEPLEPFHRLLVLAARTLVSHYRLLVAIDPGPWVDARRTELWRSALVRASVGRTSVWITNDVELADRADHVFEFIDGALRRSL